MAKTEKKPQDPSKPKKARFDYVLALIVFMSGASLMSLELVGSRIIAPTYGSSIYTWGSLLGIFMLALSLGYFFGGMLADKFPSYATLAIILALAGVFTIVIPFITLPVCEAFVGAKQKWGSLFSCLVLFSPASICMGMVSPLAIRLLAKDIEKVGKVAGSLYALSTVGSIAGTFLTSFVLITEFGMFALTRGIGVVLFLTALISVARLFSRKGRAAVVVLVIVLIPVLGGTIPAFALDLPLTIDSSNVKVLATEDSPYNTLFVIDSGNERTLQFNDRQESGFYLDNPHRSSFSYTASMHTVFAVKKDIRKVLLIGGGGAVLPIEFVCAYDDIEFDSVEIDPGVVEYSDKYFVQYAIDYFSNPNNQFGPEMKEWPERLRNNIRLITDDGRLFVRRPEARGKYDLIIMDAYLGGRIPFHLTTSEFFKELQQCLTSDGIMAMNIISAYRGERALVFRSLYRTIAQFLPNILIVPPRGSYLSGCRSPMDIQAASEEVPNIVLIAARVQNPTGAKTREILNRLIVSGFYPRHISLRISGILGSIGTIEDYAAIEDEIVSLWARTSHEKAPKLPPLIDPQRDIILTDEYAPVDIWSGYTLIK